jgi:hypothetical protein
VRFMSLADLQFHLTVSPKPLHVFTSLLSCLKKVQFTGTQLDNNNECREGIRSRKNCVVAYCYVASSAVCVTPLDGRA